jgi:hypothetical protein
MNDLIFSIYTSVTDTTKKRTHNQKQFKKHFTRLKNGLKNYADVCNADFKLLTPDTTDYDNLNVYKLQQWEKFCDDYDRVLYLDFDIIPNTNINIFSKFDFNKVVTHLLPVNSFNERIGLKTKTESTTDFYVRTKSKDFEKQKKELDQYHWLIKGQQKRDMMKSDGVTKWNDVIANTGTFGGSAISRNELKFSERLDHCKKLIDSIKHIDDRYFYNNEIIISFMLDRYNIPTVNLPPHWHELVLTDTVDARIKYSYLLHVITKDFDKVFDILDS